MAIKEYIMTNPRVSIVVISGLVSLFISFVNHLVLDKDKVRGSKARQKEIRKEMKEHKGNVEKLKELQNEMFKDSMDNMKHSFRPMLITFLPIIVVFYWIRNIFTEALVGWFWWYLVSAIVFSMIFRKLFKLP